MTRSSAAEPSSFLLRTASVGAGGAVGTLLRLGLNHLAATGTFPFGTVIENLAGSLLLGLVMGWLVHRSMPELLRAGVAVGFCGGFTTMSTFASDLVYLMEVGSGLKAALYLAASLLGGGVCALAGLRLGGRLAVRGMEAQPWSS